MQLKTLNILSQLWGPGEEEMIFQGVVGHSAEFCASARWEQAGNFELKFKAALIKCCCGEPPCAIVGVYVLGCPVDMLHDQFRVVPMKMFP